MKSKQATEVDIFSLIEKYHGDDDDKSDAVSDALIDLSFTVDRDDGFPELFKLVNSGKPFCYSPGEGGDDWEVYPVSYDKLVDIIKNISL